MKLADLVPPQKLMPLICADTVAQVVEDASIYRDAGYQVVEVLCRTSCAIEAIAQTCKEMPDLIVGAGTVLSVETAQQAREAGAQFLVSPATDPVILAFAHVHGMDMIPGVYSPTDVAIALRHGFMLHKLFPAEPDGLTHLNAFASPYTHTGVKMVCGNGIVRENAAAYLRHPLVAALIADWLVPLRSTALREELAKTKAWFKSL